VAIDMIIDILLAKYVFEGKELLSHIYQDSDWDLWEEFLVDLDYMFDQVM
jgi:hypothetical protein